jgi:hypothetical protein
MRYAICPQGMRSLEGMMPRQMPRAPFIADLACEHCGAQHHDLAFEPLRARVIRLADGWTYTHMAACPATNRPLLLTVMPSAASLRKAG